MKRKFIAYFIVLLMAVLITGCQQKKQKVSEEIERDVETLTNRIDELDRQLQELSKSVESLKKDVDSRMSQIDSTMKRIESSRFEAKLALDEINARIKGEKKLTVAQRKMLPIGVRIILIIIILVLLVILIKKATAHPYRGGAEAGLSSGESAPSISQESDEQPEEKDNPDKNQDSS